MTNPAPLQNPIRPHHIRPVGRVLSAEDAALYHDAAGALATAQAEAQRLVAAAEAEAASLRRAAQAEGRERGENEAAGLMVETASRTLVVLQSLRGAIADAIAAGVAQVIGTMDVDEAVAAAAAHAVAQISGSARIVVHVAPERAPFVRSRLASYHGTCLVTEDRTLGPDECSIETSFGFVRAGLSAQLAVLRDALKAAGQASPEADAQT